MLHSLYLIVAVIFRVLALAAMLFGGFTTLLTLPIRVNGNAIVSFPYGVSPVLIGIIIWMLAKPMARAVVSKLE